MTDPEFFVPDADTDAQEAAYIGLAKFAGEYLRAGVPGPAERVFSIVFVHDGEEWTATVGQPLRGIRRTIRRRKAGKVEVKEWLSDSAIVLAIFPGNPYVVVTDHGITRDARSRWANPFLAGSPSSVTLFSRTRTAE